MFNFLKAFSHIKDACEQRMKELYPAGIPAFIQKRYAKELALIKENEESIEQLFIFHKLSEAARQNNSYFTISGTASISYIVYLLGVSQLNPLHTHYYCPKCGHFELVEDSLYCIDLPIKECPSCQSSLCADGFDLPMELLWGDRPDRSLYFEHRIATDFAPIAQEVLQQIYPSHIVYPLKVLFYNPGETEPTVIRPGFAILPVGKTADDYPQLHTTTDDGTPILVATYDQLFDNTIPYVITMPNETIDYMMKKVAQSGINPCEISIQDMKNLTWQDLVDTGYSSEEFASLIKEVKPQTMTELIHLENFSHSTFTIMENETSNYIKKYFELYAQPIMQKYPIASGEELFHILIREGYSKEDATFIVRDTRRGLGANTPSRLLQYYPEIILADDFFKLASYCRYLAPLGQSIEDVLAAARLACLCK